MAFLILSPNDTMIIFLLILTTTFSQLNSLSFNFTAFERNNSDIMYKGDAFSSHSAIYLNEGLWNQTGHATYVKPMHLWDNASGSLADFNTSFSFTIDSAGRAVHADGLAFFLASEDYRMPVEKQGSGLGLASGDMVLNSTANPFVAVEFDTFYSPWDDMIDDHVGIDINSLKSTKSLKWNSGVTNGRRIDAVINYNSGSKNLCVYFSGFTENIEVQQNLCCEIDLQKYLPEWVICGFSAATGNYYEDHIIHSWSLESILQSHPVNMITLYPSKHQQNKTVIIAVAVIGSVVGACIIVLIGVVLIRRNFRQHRTRTGQTEGASFNVHQDGGYTESDSSSSQSQNSKFERINVAKKIAYDVLARATNHFDENEKLGQGGFGAVFRGYLRDRHVAVKRISECSIQGVEEYKAEVMILSQVRHRNLVELIGWCHENKEILVVYEYLPNRSLDYHLYSKGRSLDWETRYKIIQGLASGLQYLHTGLRRCVLHRDIKSSNVMLDSNFNAMLGDFGLAKIVDHDARSQTLKGGSHGYIAPECLETGKSSSKSDIFSFGVVALELACGRRAFVQREDGTQVHIVKWVWTYYENRKILEAADQKLNGKYVKKEMECLMIVGLWCAHPDPLLRPSMTKVMNVLSFEAKFPNLPLKFPSFK